MNKRIYLDMDGVLADWNTGVEGILGYRRKDANANYNPKDWEKVRQHQRMYKNLPLMPDANRLANTARKFRDQLGWELLILTAIPKDNDFKWAFWDKFVWANKYFPDIPVHFGPFAKDKQKHCNPGDILVDDRKSNCDEWKEKGGIAIKVVDERVDLAIDQLEEIFKELTL